MIFGWHDQMESLMVMKANVWVPLTIDCKNSTNMLANRSMKMILAIHKCAGYRVSWQYSRLFSMTGAAIFGVTATKQVLSPNTKI